MHWLNGRIYEGNEVPFDIRDRGLLLGDGVFDTSLILNRRMFQREAHLKRLLASCDALGIALDETVLRQGLDAVLSRTTEAALRMIVTRGAGARGLAVPDDSTPTILISVSPLAADRFFAPVKLCPVATCRNDSSLMSCHKTLNYLDAVLAQHEAIANGADEALFFNTQDRVACVGTGNIFALIGGQLVTPPVSDGVLPGTVRKLLLDRGAEIGLEVREQSLFVDELINAELILMTNSLRLAAPVMAIDKHAFPGAEHEIFRAVEKLLRDVMRADCGVDLPAQATRTAGESLRSAE